MFETKEFQKACAKSFQKMDKDRSGFLDNGSELLGAMTMAVKDANQVCTFQFCALRVGQRDQACTFDQLYEGGMKMTEFDCFTCI
jgi:hypothetical protein